MPEVTFPQKRTVPYLHIDADEDHVHLQKGGKSTIVPLITVYEGIKKVNNKEKISVQTEKFFIPVVCAYFSLLFFMSTAI